MAKLFLDLKKMKKLSTDGKSTTFQHVAGHQIKVAHHGLSPENRAAMDALPMLKGGNPKLQESKKSPPAGKLPGEAEQHGEKGAGGMHVLADKKRMAEGGKVTDNFQLSAVPGASALTDDGSFPQTGDANYTSGEATPTDSPVDYAVMAAVPGSGMVEDAGKIAGNEMGAVGKDIADPGLLQKAMQAHGLSPDSTVGELLTKMQAKAPASMADMQAEMAAKNKMLMQQNRANYTSKLPPPKKMADGGDVTLKNLDPTEATAPSAAPSAPTGDPGAIDYDNADYANQSTAADAPYGSATPAPSPPTPPPTSPAATTTPPTQDQPPGEKPDPFGVNTSSQAFQSGIDQTKAGIFGEEAAAEKQAAIQGKALNDAIIAQHIQQATYQNHYSSLDHERQAFQADIQNRHIDPNHYLNSQGTGQRIGTALSLILGGIGSGGDPSRNPAMQFLHDQISRDIDAQKANLGKSENLLSANLHQFGNLRDATDMTRIMQSDILSNQLKQAAAQATDLGARARALQASGQLDMNTAQLQGQMAMRKTILSGMSSGQVQPEQVIRAIVPEKEQEQARKELQTAQKDQALRNDTLRAFDKVNSLSSGVGNSLNPQSYKQADAEWGATMDKLTKDTSGRVTPETVALMSTLRPARTDTASTTAVKRAKLNDILSQNMHYPTLDTYGIKGFSNTADGNPGGAQLRRYAPKQ